MLALRDRSGAILILTAITMPLLIMVIGFAVDFAYATYINQRLASAADAAALGATSQSAATAVGGYTNTAGLQTYGMNIFLEDIKGLPISSPNFTLTVTRDSSGLVTATGSYSTSTPALFGRLLGITSIPIADLVKSTAKPAVYVNYYILVDTSQSMGVASTQNDMNTLYARVAQFGQGSDGESGCVYGCHVASPGASYTNEQLAHDFSPRVTLRIDSAVQAIQSIINTAASVASSTDNIQFGLYTIQADPVANSMVTKVAAPPSSDYPTLYNLAGTIDLGNNVGSVGYGDSDFPNELTAFNSMLPANGSGVSAASPQNYVFIVTDGVTDTYSGSCFDTHCTSALDSTQCTQLKAKATVGVIYTTFLPIYNYDKPKQKEYDPVYKSLVLPIADQIAPALQDCATSSEYYFEATYGQDIINAMSALFIKTLPSSTRLTQ